MISCRKVGVNMSQLPTKKKSFEKDESAHKIVELMVQDDFSEIPDIHKADQSGLTLEEYTAYMNDPTFLRWAVKNMQDLYVAKLPQVLNTIYNQAVGGA